MFCSSYSRHLSNHTTVASSLFIYERLSSRHCYINGVAFECESVPVNRFLFFFYLRYVFTFLYHLTKDLKYFLALSVERRIYRLYPMQRIMPPLQQSQHTNWWLQTKRIFIYSLKYKNDQCFLIDTGINTIKFYL